MEARYFFPPKHYSLMEIGKEKVDSYKSDINGILINLIAH